MYNFPWVAPGGAERVMHPSYRRTAWSSGLSIRLTVGSSSVGRVILKTLKMELTAIVLGAQHKQWSRENKPVSHNWKKGRGRLDLNQLVGNWAVKLHLTNLTT